MRLLEVRIPHRPERSEVPACQRSLTRVLGDGPSSLTIHNSITGVRFVDRRSAPRKNGPQFLLRRGKRFSMNLIPLPYPAGAGPRGRRAGYGRQRRAGSTACTRRGISGDGYPGIADDQCGRRESVCHLEILDHPQTLNTGVVGVSLTIGREGHGVRSRHGQPCRSRGPCMKVKMGRPPRYSATSATRGSRTVNSVPAASDDRTSMEPPCAATMRSAMYRPSPRFPDSRSAAS